MTHYHQKLIENFVYGKSRKPTNLLISVFGKANFIYKESHPGLSVLKKDILVHKQ
jgi:hypothetical protein